MSTMEPLKLAKMDDDEIDVLLEEQTICRIAFKGGEYPYVAPFQFQIHEGHIYFHFTDYGRKIKLLESDNRVCVAFESIEPDLSDFSFVVISGSLELVNDSTERREVITKMAESCMDGISENFLAAHGFSREMGWSALSADKPISIVKLSDVNEVIGLKSPY